MGLTVWFASCVVVVLIVQSSLVQSKPFRRDGLLSHQTRTPGSSRFSSLLAKSSYRNSRTRDNYSPANVISISTVSPSNEEIISTEGSTTVSEGTTPSVHLTTQATGTAETLKHTTQTTTDFPIEVDATSEVETKEDRTKKDAESTTMTEIGQQTTESPTEKTEALAATTTTPSSTDLAGLFETSTANEFTDRESESGSSTTHEEATDGFHYESSSTTEEQLAVTDTAFKTSTPNEATTDSSYYETSAPGKESTEKDIYLLAFTSEGETTGEPVYEISTAGEEYFEKETGTPTFIVYE